MYIGTHDTHYPPLQQTVSSRCYPIAKYPRTREYYPSRLRVPLDTRRVFGPRAPISFLWGIIPGKSTRVVGWSMSIIYQRVYICHPYYPPTTITYPSITLRTQGSRHHTRPLGSHCCARFRNIPGLAGTFIRSVVTIYWYREYTRS